MKKILFLFIVIPLFYGCKDGKTSEGTSFIPKNEEEALSAFSALAQREGNKKEHLVLTLKNGEKKTLTTVESEEYSKAIRYELVNYYENIDCFFLNVHFYEGGYNSLVDRTTGDENVVAGAPIFSKDGASFICINSDVQSGYTANLTQIWHVSAGRLVLGFEYESKNWGPASAIWQDNNTVVINREMFDNNEGKTKPLPSKKITFKYGKWTMK